MSSISCYKAVSSTCRRSWNINEIQRLTDAVAIEKAANANDKIDWRIVARRVGTRDRVQCYQRYRYVDSAGKRGTQRHSWSVDEAIQLLKCHVVYGNNWSMYLEYIPGRTLTEIKCKFLSLQRSLVSKNSDIWRIDEYAPYREHLRKSLYLIPYKQKQKQKRKSLESCISCSSERQLQLIWALRHSQKTFMPNSFDRNISTYPLSSKDASRRRRRKGDATHISIHHTF